MKKIKTLFLREYDKKHRVIGISREVSPDMEWVLRGEGAATIKFDGVACAVIGGELYMRQIIRNGKIPEGAIPCCESDSITGHWPHWVKVDMDRPDNECFCSAFYGKNLSDGTYEAIGLHFRKNPYNLKKDILVPHGVHLIEIERSFEGIRKWLSENNEEGLVFWKDGEPMCKIKRTDFGLPWPIVKEG